jgi:hypothetical protein
MLRFAKKLAVRDVVTKIVSGGQSGVDRVALEVAMAQGYQHGGWCPQGRLAEDGAIPVLFQLTETESDRYPVRTNLNVRDSDATLILYRVRMSGGTALTARLADQQRKPFRAIDLAHGDVTGQFQHVRQWLMKVRPATLNVAGPRESTNPGIGLQARELLARVFRS